MLDYKLVHWMFVVQTNKRQEHTHIPQWHIWTTSLDALVSRVEQKAGVCSKQQKERNRGMLKKRGGTTLRWCSLVGMFSFESKPPDWIEWSGFTKNVLSYTRKLHSVTRLHVLSKWVVLNAGVSICSEHCSSSSWANMVTWHLPGNTLPLVSNN